MNAASKMEVALCPPSWKMTDALPDGSCWKGPIECAREVRNSCKTVTCGVFVESKSGWHRYVLKEVFHRDGNIAIWKYGHTQSDETIIFRQVPDAAVVHVTVDKSALDHVTISALHTPDRYTTNAAVEQDGVVAKLSASKVY